MASSKLVIFNQALNLVGSDELISDPDEVSREAEVCRLWYDEVRDRVLRAAPWSSARKTSRLALKKARDFSKEWQSTDPDPSYSYAYGLPNDLLRPRFLADFRQFTLGTIQPNNERILLTNAESPLLTYTFRQEVVSAWDADLTIAISHGLGAFIGGPLGMERGRIQDALALANDTITIARTNEANQDFTPLDTVPEWLTARGYAQPAELTRYFYPNDNMLALPGGARG